MIVIFEKLTKTNKAFTSTIDAVLNRIKNGASKVKVEDIRSKLFLGEDYDAIKRELPCIVFSASKVEPSASGSLREDVSVVEHSGFLTLDFDKVADPELKIQQLKNDPYIYATWLSPTGTGVRALVRCPTSIENHKAYYIALIDRYPDLDPTSKNIARVTFESYDPNIYINKESLCWDRKVTEEQRSQKESSKPVNRKGTQILSTAVAMVRASYDGTKHQELLKAANLVGGYVAAGRVDEQQAISVLESEISAKGALNAQAKKTIRDGIDNGKMRPLEDLKKIERENQFLKRADGSFDFLADEEEMDHYIESVLDGSIRMGLPTGLNGLNPHWLLKEHSLDFFCGADNTGKSFLVWYLSVLACKFHNWKVLIQSSENNDGELRKKIQEFYLGKSLKVATQEELADAKAWFKKHYCVISHKVFHTMEDCLMKCELVYDNGFEFNLVILEPWNSFDIPAMMDGYRNNIRALNLLRTFKANYASVWICDHIGTTSARTKSKDGYQQAPSKADVEGGQIKANKCDNMIIIHRLSNHPDKWNETQVHVVKIKSVETGGRITPKDNPVILKMNPDFCGYHSNGVDPINKNRIIIEGKIGEQIKLV